MGLNHEFRLHILTHPVDTIVHDGETWAVFPTDVYPTVPLGFIMQFRFAHQPGQLPASQISESSYSDWTAFSSNLTPGFDFGGSFTDGQKHSLYFGIRGNLVWLGPVPIPQDGSIPDFNISPNFLGKVGVIITKEKRVNGIPMPDGSNHDAVHFDGYGSQFSFAKNGTCTTPSLEGANAVFLPMVNQSDFGGIDTFAGEKDFDLTFFNCAINMYRIHYKISSPNPADNVGNPLALLSLSASSTAQGIKLQLLNRDTGSPIEMDTFRVASQYTGSQTSFAIPFRVRYYQVDPAVTAGTVRATALFHIIYQ